MRLEYEGRFLAHIDDVGLFQSKTSQAVAINFFFSTESYFDGDEQHEYSGYRVRGRFWVIGRSGDVLPEQAAAVADATGWDGSLDAIHDGSWRPESPVQITVEKETSGDGRTYYNAVRIHRADWQPARAGNVSAGDARQIAARYSSALKSVVAKYRRQQAEEPVDAEPAEPDPNETPAPAPTPAAVSDEGPWTMRKAWETLRAKAGDMSEDEFNLVWQETVRYYGNQKPTAEMTSDEWKQVASIDPKSWTPF